MTISHPIRSLLARGLAAALAIGGAGCVAYPSAPAQPAFDTEVGPIFLAHCARCHGEGPDGGAQNAAGVPGMTYNTAGPPRPIGPFLTQFGDTCSPLPDGSAGTCQNGADCLHCGAFTYVSLIQERVHGTANMAIMPPPPAPLLNDWELNVVDAWAKNPICSHSAKPDPTICPGP